MSIKQIITSKDIIEAQAKHGSDFVVFRFDAIRAYQNKCQYINIDILKADGKQVEVRFWKLSNDGLTTGSRIRSPEKRLYAAIRVGITSEPENENCLAMKLVCDAVNEKLTALKKSDKIVDDEKVAKKNNAAYLISTKIVTPMQTDAADKDGKIIEMENPFFWLSLPKKYVPKSEIVEKEHFENMYYMDASNQPDLDNPIYVLEYNPKFFNVDDFYHDSKTGKKIFRPLGALSADGKSAVFNNTNIQDYLTKGSAFMGNLKFEIVVSGRQCKLDIGLHGNIYVKVADTVDNIMTAEDEEDIGEFASRHTALNSGSAVPADIEDNDFDEE